jgi:hypothetical protein
MKSLRDPDVESAERFNGAEAMLSVRFMETDASPHQAVFTVLLPTGSVWSRTVSIVKDHVEK